MVLPRTGALTLGHPIRPRIIPTPAPHMVASSSESFLLRELLPRYVRPSAHVLDLGCGAGANLARLHQLGLRYASYLGVDQLPQVLRWAHHRYARRCNVGFQRGNIEQLALPDGRFDLVLCTWVLSQVRQPRAVVNEALRAVSDDGLVVVVFRTNARFAAPRLPLAPDRFLVNATFLTPGTPTRPQPAARPAPRPPADVVWVLRGRALEAAA